MGKKVLDVGLIEAYRKRTAGGPSRSCAHLVMARIRANPMSGSGMVTVAMAVALFVLGFSFLATIKRQNQVTQQVPAFQCPGCDSVFQHQCR